MGEKYGGKIYFARIHGGDFARIQNGEFAQNEHSFGRKIIFSLSCHPVWLHGWQICAIAYMLVLIGAVYMEGVIFF